MTMRAIAYYKGLRGLYDDQSDEVIECLVDGLISNYQWMLDHGTAEEDIISCPFPEYPELEGADSARALLYKGSWMSQFYKFVAFLGRRHAQEAERPPTEPERRLYLAWRDLCHLDAVDAKLHARVVSVVSLGCTVRTLPGASVEHVEVEHPPAVIAAHGVGDALDDEFGVFRHGIACEMGEHPVHIVFDDVTPAADGQQHAANLAGLSPLGLFDHDVDDIAHQSHLVHACYLSPMYANPGGRDGRSCRPARLVACVVPDDFGAHR